MGALLTKDFYILLSQLKFILFTIVVFSIMGGSTFFIMAILMGAVLSTTTMSYDEQSKWNNIAQMLPYSKAQLVLSKYVLGYICIGGVCTVVLLVQFFSLSLGIAQGAINIEILISAMCLALTFLAINTPVTLKFGTAKGRLVLIGVMAFSGAFGVLIENIHISIPLILCATILLNIISIKLCLSLRLYQN